MDIFWVRFNFSALWPIFPTDRKDSLSLFLILFLLSPQQLTHLSGGEWRGLQPF